VEKNKKLNHGVTQRKHRESHRGEKKVKYNKNTIKEAARKMNPFKIKIQGRRQGEQF